MKCLPWINKDDVLCRTSTEGDDDEWLKERSQFQFLKWVGARTRKRCLFYYLGKCASFSKTRKNPWTEYFLFPRMVSMQFEF